MLCSIPRSAFGQSVECRLTFVPCVDSDTAIGEGEESRSSQQGAIHQQAVSARRFGDPGLEESEVSSHDPARVGRRRARSPMRDTFNR
eukprot:scaffold938_cov334-Pavlova_lutheri.AAC.32